MMPILGASDFGRFIFPLGRRFILFIIDDEDAITSNRACKCLSPGPVRPGGGGVSAGTKQKKINETYFFRRKVETSLT